MEGDFFFQAEDGIRDSPVTGVQTCALPIYIGKGVEAHNVPFVILGASLLWFGWFGFNAGSGLAADGLAISAFLVTNTCAATAMLIWVILGMIQIGRAHV